MQTLGALDASPRGRTGVIFWDILDHHGVNRKRCCVLVSDRCCNSSGVKMLPVVVFTLVLAKWLAMQRHHHHLVLRHRRREYSRRINQSGACSSSDVIMSRGRKSQTTMEDKLIEVVCGYLELYDTTTFFFKNRNRFCNETGAPWQKPPPPPHDTNSCLLCSEFCAQMKRISRANEASKLKMFRHPTTHE